MTMTSEPKSTNLRLGDLHGPAAACAEVERRSLNALVCQAVEEYLQRHVHEAQVDASIAKMLPRYANTLRRLGE